MLYSINRFAITIFYYQHGSHEDCKSDNNFPKEGRGGYEAGVVHKKVLMGSELRGLAPSSLSTWPPPHTQWEVEGSQGEGLRSPHIIQLSPFPYSLLTPSQLTQPLEPILVPRGYRSNFLTSLTYIFLWTRGCLPWRCGVDMGMAWHENHTLSQGFSRANGSALEMGVRAVLYGDIISMFGQANWREFEPLERKENCYRAHSRCLLVHFHCLRRADLCI